MQKRRVTSPDGTKWIVGRRWLLHRPRYFGFRFGVDEHEPSHEPPRPGLTAERKPAPTKPPTPPVVRYSTKDKKRRKRRRSYGGGSSGGRSGGGWWIFSGRGRSFGGGSRSSGGGSRGSSGGGRRGSSGGGKRGGGGGGGASAAGGILTLLVKALKYIAIVLAVIAAALFVVFVLIPALVFLVQYLAFWVVIGVTIAYRAMSGRPWIIEMEEADGYRVRSWRVAGWAESKAAIDDIAEAIRAGEEPAPAAPAEPVEIVNARV